MKLLLDENLPKQLLNDFSEYEALTIQQNDWGGKTNGELLKLMLAAKIDAFLTADKNLQHQQNFKKYPIPV
jgi:predicted nuclease of predicted toxin-antitoxin system